MKKKYVRLGRDDIDAIIVFPMWLEHRSFRHFGVVSAGFCYIDEDKVRCFGRSISLGLDSQPKDSDIATRQFFDEE